MLVLLGLTAGGLYAQGTENENVREAQLRKLDLERNTLLAMADSMPESLYRDRVTPEQRDFAQQIHHAASAAALICARYFASEQPTLPDTSVALNSRAGLKEYINAAYDFSAQSLKDETASDRTEVVDFFGMMEIPKWQIWDEIHTHTIWTAGQVVANFRKHGMPPPAFAFF
jgi:hypothetical protein